jgi:hypothetical protein
MRRVPGLGARRMHASFCANSPEMAHLAVVNRNLNPVYSSRGFHLFLPSVLLLLYVPLNAHSALAANPSISDP